MADVFQRALDPRVPPRRILLRHPHDEPSNLQQDAATTGPPGVAPLPRDQLTMPPEQRIGRRDRRDLLQGRTAHTVRPCSQPSTIVVGETRSAGPKLTPQKPVLFGQVRDRFPLSAVQPAGEYAQHHLERRRVDHGAELTSLARLKGVGRELEHYGLRRPIN